MRRQTMGQLLLDEALPEDMRGVSRTLDKKGVAALFDELARRHPERFREVSKKLTDVARDAAQATGGFSFGLAHMAASPAGERIKAQLAAELAQIRSRHDLGPDDRDRAIIDRLVRAKSKLDEAVFSESKAENNPLAHQVANVGRGNKGSLAGLRSGDLLYVDQNDRPIPIPVMNSYARGLDPAEYFAASFGARKGVVDTKLSVAQAGYLSKQINQFTHRLVVTGDDHDDGVDRSDRGLPVAVDDPDNVGALLARPAGLLGRDAVLTPEKLAQLKSHGVERILVRSPVVGGPAMGGVLAKDVGIRERGRLAPRGDFVGLAAAQAVGEKVSQGMLCLAEGTSVRMANGTTMAIEQIRPGDQVMGANQHGQGLAVTVTAVHANGLRDCRSYRFGLFTNRLELIDSYAVVMTPDHKVLRDCNDWETTPGNTAYVPVPIGEWKLHDLAPGIESWDLGNPPTTTSHNLEDGLLLISDVGPFPRQTYDLTVDHPDHLFVLACGIIVSNSSKHAGGVAGQAAAPSGFKLLDSILQVPRVFPGGAAHAQRAGTVTGIEPAPQGGTLIKIDGHPHHARHGQNPTVQIGDKVEPGDVLSDGVPNPRELVAHKGIGEGRLHYMNGVQAAMTGSNMKAHRRNLELLARGAVDHVELDHEVGPHVPGDVLSYQALEAAYEPREDAQERAPKQALGRYLERPVLHHTIGTEIRPSMVKDLEAFGIPTILTHEKPPPFHPVMIRAKSVLEYDPDFMTRHLGSNLQRSTLEAAHRGRSSDTSGTSYVPALAERAHFGRRGWTQGWDPRSPRDGDGDGRVGDGTPGEKAAYLELDELWYG